MGQLTDKVAVVTGAGRGIGRAIALELGKRGAAVVVNYNASAEAANGVVADIVAQGGKAVAVKADVSVMAEAEALIKAAVDQFGKIDILVNNAGTTRDNLIMLMSESEWDTVLDTNLKSVWNCSKAASKAMMRKKYGRIINITSISGIAGQGGQTNYSASKAGIIGFTKALAREIGPRSITVNAVAPGLVHTDMTANLPEDMAEQSGKSIPLGRWGTPEEIGQAVAFLASDDAAYITGHVLSVDGGLIMG